MFVTWIGAVGAPPATLAERSLDPPLDPPLDDLGGRPMGHNQAGFASIYQDFLISMGAPMLECRMA